jgi:hypothetical protein
MIDKIHCWLFGHKIKIVGETEPAVQVCMCSKCGFTFINEINFYHNEK